MRRTLSLIALVLIGVVAGASTLLWIQDRAAGESDGGTASATRASASDRETPTSLEPTTAADPSSSAVLLAWTSGGLPDGFARRVLELPRVDHVALVRGDLVELARSWDADGVLLDAPADGGVIPMDVLAVDPESYGPFMPKDFAVAVNDLGPSDAVLGETSAELRSVGVGGSLELADGSRMQVAAVVPDELIGGAEMLVRSRADGPVTTPRFLLLLYSGPRAEVEAAVRRALEQPSAIRFRSPAETPFLRHGDAVLTQAQVKARFGEFSYRHRPDGVLEVDEEWASANLLTEEVPILGRITCHRAVMPAIRSALAQIEADGLAWLVSDADYGGCFSARMASNGHNVSRHTWGIAIDLNSGKFPLGFDGDQDPRLASAMLGHGFTSGADWLVPDPAHFEWVRPPVGN